MATLILPSPDSESFDSWIAALDRRHLSALTPSEAARALRALSSCYVERRARLAEGGPLDSAGKRAAFALFYGPLHFLVTHEVVRALPGASDPLSRVDDLGCGTGAAGAAWALGSGAATVRGVDRNAWAVAEALWTYRHFGLRGGAVRQAIGQARLRPGPTTGVLLAYAVNELPDPARAALLEALQNAHAGGARVLVLEPIARRATPWWDTWERAVRNAGGRTDEWRFPSSLPPRQLALARAAGLNPRELTARTLYLP